MSEALTRENLYEEYYQKVFGYIRSRVRTYQDAEDLCADVFVKVYEKLDTYDQSKSRISTWIFSVTRNTVIDYYRTYHLNEELPDEFKDSISEDEPILDDDSLETLASALKKLSEEERAIIVMRYYHGDSLQDISKKMKMSYGITKLRHRSALAKLKKLLKSQFEFE